MFTPMFILAQQAVESTGINWNVVLSYSLVVLLVSIAFYAGKLLARIESLEKWRESYIQEMKEEFNSIHNSIREIKDLITNGA